MFEEKGKEKKKIEPSQSLGQSDRDQNLFERKSNKPQNAMYVKQSDGKHAAFLAIQINAASFNRECQRLKAEPPEEPPRFL